jgi:hypothetical protein
MIGKEAQREKEKYRRFLADQAEKLVRSHHAGLLLKKKKEL